MRADIIDAIFNTLMLCKACQKAHWKSHKKKCKKLVARLTKSDEKEEEKEEAVAGGEKQSSSGEDNDN